MPDNRVKYVQVYLDSKMAIECTENTINKEGGTGLVQTAGGAVIQEGTQQTTLSLTAVVRRGVPFYEFINRKFTNREKINVTRGITGTVSESGACLVQSLSSPSQAADGSTTMQFTLIAIDGNLKST